MSSVHLDHIEAGSDCASRGGNLCVDEGGYVIASDLDRRRFAFAQRNGAGPDHLPWMFAAQFHILLRHWRATVPRRPGAGLAAGML